MSSEQAGPSRASLQRSDDHASSSKSDRLRPVSLDEVDLNEERTDRDLSLLISQYLHTRPHPSLARAFDEEVLGVGRNKQHLEDADEVERVIIDGEWGLLEGLVSAPGLLKPSSQRAFMYMAFRTQFLEHIENRESQKAFNLLQKRLKPLEHYQATPQDFLNLCYLTSAGTVHDAPGLRDWKGVGPEREKLVHMWRELIQTASTDGTGNVPPGRLVTLMRQAAAWQVSTAKRRTRPYVVKTLLEDYAVRVVPDTERLRVKGHAANVKCVDFMDGEYAVSGSSDSTLRIFSTVDGTIRHVLTGHRSRIWDCATSESGRYLLSGSGDGTVRLWTTQDGQLDCVLDGNGGDVYAVRWKPHSEGQAVSAHYDRILRVWDLETGSLLRTFSGHAQSTLTVAYDHTGNLLASGSKDKHVRLWDSVGGTCVKSLSGSLGEITSVDFDQDGKYLLAGCKDNSNRLWDLRMNRILYRYTGHQNTSKNLIRAAFGGYDSSLIISGSEDGNVYLWNREQTAAPAAPRQEGVASPIAFGQSAMSRASSLRIPSVGTDDRSSPAYYPPRAPKTSVPVGHGAGTNVRPLKVLEGHGEGAVFDVRWKEGEVMSSGEDGSVIVWAANEAEQE